MLRAARVVIVGNLSQWFVDIAMDESIRKAASSVVERIAADIVEDIVTTSVHESELDGVRTSVRESAVMCVLSEVVEGVVTMHEAEAAAAEADVHNGWFEVV